MHVQYFAPKADKTIFTKELFHKPHLSDYYTAVHQGLLLQLAAGCIEFIIGVRAPH